MPDLKRVSRTWDAGIGFLNGVLGGATGLGGILPTLWCVLRGWPPDEHRAVSQPTAVATFALSLLAFGGMGLVTAETTRLFLIGLPVLVAGTLLGWSLYGKLDEVTFRKVVLILLLVSEVAIVVTGADFRIWPFGDISQQAHDDRLKSQSGRGLRDPACRNIILREQD